MENDDRQKKRALYLKLVKKNILPYICVLFVCFCEINNAEQLRVRPLFGITAACVFMVLPLYGVFYGIFSYCNTKSIVAPNITLLCINIIGSSAVFSLMSGSLELISGTIMALILTVISFIAACITKLIIWIKSQKR